MKKICATLLLLAFVCSLAVSMSAAVQSYDLSYEPVDVLYITPDNVNADGYYFYQSGPEASLAVRIESGVNTELTFDNVTMTYWSCIELVNSTVTVNLLGDNVLAPAMRAYTPIYLEGDSNLYLQGDGSLDVYVRKSEGHPEAAAVGFGGLFGNDPMSEKYVTVGEGVTLSLTSIEDYAVGPHYDNAVCAGGIILEDGAALNIKNGIIGGPDGSDVRLILGADTTINGQPSATAVEGVLGKNVTVDDTKARISASEDVYWAYWRGIASQIRMNKTVTTKVPADIDQTTMPTFIFAALKEAGNASLTFTLADKTYEMTSTNMPKKSTVFTYCNISEIQAFAK